MTYLLLFLTALLAGATNAVAGGGTFFTFPALTGAGLPVLLANATNAVAVSPGHALASVAYRRELAQVGWRLAPLSGIAALGALAGAALLTVTSPHIFARLVPWLILFATLLFAAAPRLQAALALRATPGRGRRPGVQLAACFVSSVYGGYFGAGLGILLMAVIALTGETDVQAANARKNLIAAIVAVMTIAFLGWRGLIIWPYALPMLAGATLGGLYGGQAARRLSPARLRKLVILVGSVLTVYYFLA